MTRRVIQRVIRPLSRAAARTPLRRAVVAVLAAAAGIAQPVAARDYGQQGAVFAIIEPDLLEVIKQRLMRLEANGAVDAGNRAFAARAVASVRRPPPIAAIGTATAPRAWLVDPTIMVAQDLRDARGRVVIAAGTRVNPLDTMRLRAPLVFLDGDDARQVAWATGATLPPSAKLILVRGAPLDLMHTRQRRFYFDQSGVLTTRLGIHAVPALVVQRGRQLVVRELVLAPRGAVR